MKISVHIEFGLREKISLTIIAFSMVVTTVLSINFYSRSVNTIKENYTASMEMSMTVCADAFDDVMRDAYYACVYAANDSELQNQMQSATVDSFPDLAQTMKEYLNTNSSLDSIYCYLKEQNALIKVDTSGTQTVKECDADDLAWIEELKTDDNPLSPLYVKEEISAIQKQLFTYTRAVTDETGEELGSLIVNVDERTIFFKCLQSNELAGDGESYIVKNRDIVSATNLNRLGSELDVSYEGNLVVQVDMEMTDYSIVSAVDMAVITSDMRSIRNQTLATALLLNLLGCILVFWIVRKMMHPMEELGRTMDQVSQGDLKARAVIYHEDEIGRLSEGFNNMVTQIEQLIEELVTERMLKKEAEIEALQYQITPHFMYNTLNSIKYAAYLQNSTEIADLLEAFIELLQLSASDRGAFIRVEQEIHMVQNYVKLQQFRYADSFTVTFDIQPQANDCYVPRLIVQPLVENAILHGINRRNQRSHISVSAVISGRYLAIKVEDNGEGMTAREMQRLMSGEQRSKFSGIGVSNIRERLKLYYGDQGKMSFLSEPGEGTKALLIFPVSHDPDEFTI